MKTKVTDRVLFVGIGGGNDVFSTILAALSLWQMGWRWKSCSLAGVLSPFHHHDVVGLTTLPGVSCVWSNSKRKVVRRDKEFEIGFVDACVAKLVAEQTPVLAQEVFGLSLREGSEGVTQTFKLLAEEFDYFVLVDVGGDCFYRGKEDTHVLSPMFDALVIRGFVDSGVPGILFEAGPGTDGELEVEALEQVLSQIATESYQLQSEAVNEWEKLYKQCIEPVRTGNTVPTTIQAFRCQEEFMVRPYSARAHIGTARFYSKFEQRIKTSLCRQVFLLDPARIRNPFAVKCISPFDWFMQTQVARQRTNCEANLEYTSYGGDLCQFLTPSPLFPEYERKLIIQYGLSDLRHATCDSVLMFPSDLTTALDGFWVTEMFPKGLCKVVRA
ncbi:MAG: DUF1152 domain-containing protein [Patescibacteria group bacterium]